MTTLFYPVAEGYAPATPDVVAAGTHEFFVRRLGTKGVDYRRATAGDLASVPRLLAVVTAGAAPEPASEAHVPSADQQAIYDFVRNGRGDLLVKAQPGSGKTTTIVGAARIIKASAIFAAFNQSIVKTLKGRLPAHMTVTTLHSLGNRAVSRVLGRCTVDDTKYLGLVRGFLHEDGIADPDRVVEAAILDVVRFIQSQLVHPMDRPGLMAMIQKFTIDIPAGKEDLVLHAAAVVLRRGIAMARDERLLSYGDMLWLPHMVSNEAGVIGRGLPVKQAFYVFIDEAQDLSPAQLAIAMKARMRGGRMVFVGDENQAINAFAGADSRSMDRIVEATQATQLPLSVCYRCPTKHIALAKGLVPSIQAAPGATEGILETVTEAAMVQMAREGDLILCRNTAPLIAACFKLIQAGVGARVRGKDIGQAVIQTLGRLVRWVESRGGGPLLQALAPFEAEQVRACEGLPDAEQRTERVRDQVANLRAVITAAKVSTPAELVVAIEDLFSDERPSVELATIHRAKGSEADRVFLLHPERMPSKAAKTPDALRQELNTEFVALTRAKQALYMVPEAKK